MQATSESVHPVFVIVGPPAVGKSTTSKALAARFPKSLHIPVDDVRTMVVSGLVLPSATWSDELTHQIALARASVTHMALAYRAAGFVAVIDDFWDPSFHLDYQALLDQPHTHKVLLYPQQEEAHRRNFTRSGDTPARGYIDEGIRIVYQQLSDGMPQWSHEGWLVMDTTTLSVEETVEIILQRTASTP